MKLMKDNMLQSDDVMFPHIKVRKLQIDLTKVCCLGSFKDCDAIEEESKEDDDDINYD